MGMSKFQPLHCARPDCNSIISGSMFISRNPDGPSVVCEDCYRSHYYGKNSYTKKHKHCSLPELVTPETSRDLCPCRSVLRYDSNGDPVALLPIEKKSDHPTSECGLIQLEERIARAKCNGLQGSVGIKDTKMSSIFSQEVDTVKAEAKAHKEADMGKGKKSEKRWSVAGSTSRESAERDAASSASVVTEAEADTDIPVFFRRFAKKHPFGDVHMALRVGPLVIENGVAH